MAVVSPQAQRRAPEAFYGEEGLLGVRPAASYNRAEQQYSALLYRRLEQLLKGERNDLLLLRKYHDQPDRLGAMSTPNELDRRALRLEMVEKTAIDVMVFLSDTSSGGPIAQQVNRDGQVIETRQFPTRYPHIVIHRVDIYRDGAEVPESTEWCAQRMQNQRTSTRINRALDAANLGLDVLQSILGRPSSE